MNPNDCSGVPTIPAGQSENPFVWEAVQLYCRAQFAFDFEQRHGGIVISEREHAMIGHRNPVIDRVLTALAQDFRSHKGGSDWRKPDALGISEDGQLGELLEVTTEKQYLGARGPRHAAVQLEHKLDTLNKTVNRNHNLTTVWRGALWKPALEETPTLPSFLGVRWICFRPNYRQVKLEQGIVLYEVHELLRDQSPVPVVLPQEIRRMIQQWVKTEPLRTELEDPINWALRLLARNTALTGLLRAILVSVALAGLFVLLIELGVSLLAALALALAANYLEQRPQQRNPLA